MDRIFLHVLNMSFTGGIVIIMVCIARLLFRKSPRLFSYALWSVVLFRLVCPVSFESRISLLPTRPSPIPNDIMYQQIPQMNTGIPFVNDSINAVLPAATPYASMNPIQFAIIIGYTVWLAGIAVLLCYSAISLFRLQMNLKNAVHECDNIYTCAEISSPFVMGILRPRIYLPANLSAAEKPYILLHEQTHIRRLDYLVKVVSFFVLCLHWFNPLVWTAFFMSGRDMELSCDESVIKALGRDVKKEYSSSLLALATGKRIVNATPLAFGEGDTKRRIKHVLHYKKPAFWVVVLSLLAVCVVLAGLLTNPREVQAQNDWAATIYSYRTPYVGDNSAVSHIADNLNFPDSMERTGGQLTTTTSPYGLTIYYTDNGTGTIDQSLFDENALIAFSLIGNLDAITFSIEKDTTTEYTRTREWANQITNLDLWAETSSTDGFEKLLDSAFNLTTTNNKMLDSYYAGQSTQAYEILKSSRLIKILDHWTDETIVNPVWNYDSFTQYYLYDESTNTLLDEALYYCTFSDENQNTYDMVLRYDQADGGGLGKVRYQKTPYSYDLQANIDTITALLDKEGLDLTTASAVRVQLGSTVENSNGEAILITDGSGQHYLYRFT